jgi:hypothetical protein
MKGQLLLAASIVGLGAIVFFTLRRDVRAAGDAISDSLDPTNRANIFAKTADKLTRALSGDENQTFGGVIFDALNPDVGRDR